MKKKITMKRRKCHDILDILLIMNQYVKVIRSGKTIIEMNERAEEDGVPGKGLIGGPGISVREGTSCTSGEDPGRRTQNGVGLKTSGG